MIAAAVSAQESMGNVKIMFASLGAYGHLYLMVPLAMAPSVPCLQRIQREPARLA
jgi:hypothetical protein